jgi:pyridoxal phosphate enzyme (YggS family)
VTSIAENINRIIADIRQFESEYKRPQDAVTLLAVSKKHSAKSIEIAAAHGIHNFGENYLQEALDKMQALEQLPLIWHFIGPIQSNKTKPIAENFDWVHSVDREKIARRLSEHRTDDRGALNVCVQVNLSDEQSKSGTTLKNAADVCAVVAQLPNLTLRGLMAIPAPQSNFQDQRASFNRLKLEFKALAALYPSMDTLSMGMSNDFQAAIAEGSTMIRVGTALFGNRPT